MVKQIGNYLVPGFVIEATRIMKSFEPDEIRDPDCPEYLRVIVDTVVSEFSGNDNDAMARAIQDNGYDVEHEPEYCAMFDDEDDEDCTCEFMHERLEEVMDEVTNRLTDFIQGYGLPGFFTSDWHEGAYVLWYVVETEVDDAND